MVLMLKMALLTSLGVHAHAMGNLAHHEPPLCDAGHRPNTHDPLQYKNASKWPRLPNGSRAAETVSFFSFYRSNCMTKNVGGIDRTIRIVVGLALIAAAATGIVGLWGYVGVVPLLTGLMGWCPPYALLGFNTCSMKK
jgi:hypothetical protein